MGSFIKRMKSAHNGFRTVDMFGRASKHGKTRKEHYDTTRHRVAIPAFVGRMVFGRSFWGDKTGGITVHLGNGAHANLLNALDATMALYRVEFPEAFSPL